MQPLSALGKKELENVKLVSFDVDGVLVQTGTEIFEMDDPFEKNILIVKTKKISQELIQKINILKKNVWINISSGRSLLYLKEVFEPILWNNVSIQGENGLFTLIDGQVVQHGKLALEELDLLFNIRHEIYNLSEENKNIRGFEPKQFLISIHCFNEEPLIEHIVKKLDEKEILGIKWSSEAYNIFPKRFSKRTGIENLSKMINIGYDQMLIVGNDPNDKEATQGPGISVTTNRKTLNADYYTESELELGGEYLVDKLLEIYQ